VAPAPSPQAKTLDPASTQQLVVQIKALLAEDNAGAVELWEANAGTL
jgi:hypothetical protein